MPRHDFVCYSETCTHFESDVVLVGIDESKWEIPQHCGKPMEISYVCLDIPMHNFEAFTTRNIHPDGKELPVRNRGDLAFYAREYGVRHVNDPNLVAVGSEFRRKEKDAPSAFVDMGGHR